MEKQHLTHEQLTRSIIGAFYAVYNALGYGFLENVYVRALEIELRARGHRLAREFAVTVYYRGDRLIQHRLDLLVDGLIVLEVKSTSKLDADAMRKVPNYLKSTDLEVGLLLHFGPKPKFYRYIHSNSHKLRSPQALSAESATSEVIRVPARQMPAKRGTTPPESAPNAPSADPRSC
jgi:GxxExxY protein